MDIQQNEILPIPSSYNVPVKIGFVWGNFIFGIFAGGVVFGSIIGVGISYLLYTFYHSKAFGVPIICSVVFVSLLLLLYFSGSVKRINQIFEITQGKEVSLNHKGIKFAALLLQGGKVPGEWLPQDNWNASFVSEDGYVEVSWDQIKSVQVVTNTSRRGYNIILMIKSTKCDFGIPMQLLAGLGDPLIATIRKMSGIVNPYLN